MSSDHVEVVDLLKALRNKLRGLAYLLKPQELSSVMFGLRQCRSDRRVVKDILHIFTTNLERYSYTWHDSPSTNSALLPPLPSPEYVCVQVYATA